VKTLLGLARLLGRWELLQLRLWSSGYCAYLLIEESELRGRRRVQYR
jgi:hypothetical protein